MITIAHMLHPGSCLHEPGRREIILVRADTNQGEGVTGINMLPASFDNDTF